MDKVQLPKASTATPTTDPRNLTFASHITADERVAVCVTAVTDSAAYGIRATAAIEAGDLPEFARCLRFAVGSADLAVRTGATDENIRAGLAKARAEAATPQSADFTEQPVPYTLTELSPDLRPRVVKACEEYTDASIGELCASTDLQYLDQDGPVFFLGQFRVRALFRSTDGRYWADAALVAETATAGRDITKGVRDSWMDAAGRGIEQYDLMVASVQRGEWNALVAPLTRIAAQLHLPAPLPAPDGWTRSWNSFPDMSDEQQADAEAVLGVQR